eukprot:650068-Pleurochrysis_carterae.AAC.1
METANACAELLGMFWAPLHDIFLFFASAAADGEAVMTRDDFMRFTKAFELATYLPTSTLEETFLCSAVSQAGDGKLLNSQRFGQSLILCARAVADKKWKVAYATEKRTRFQYKYEDAWKSRDDAELDEQLLELLQVHSFYPGEGASISAVHTCIRLWLYWVPVLSMAWRDAKTGGPLAVARSRQPWGLAATCAAR